MTGSINELHPTPAAEALAEMEMQPDRYELLSLSSNYSRGSVEEAKHARARVHIAFGKGVTREELLSLVLEAMAELHGSLHTSLHLEYVPGTGEGPTPPDAAIEECREGTPHVV